MSRGSNFTDYEALENQRPSSVAADDSGFDVLRDNSKTPRDYEAEFAGAGRKIDKPELIESPVVSRAALTASATAAGGASSVLSLRRGHGLTFAGLFIFTFLVFFRPYELSASFFWLSSAAFWTALATILVFVFTQLGLEGVITARPREVNLVLLLLLTGALSIPFASEPLRSLNSFVEFLKVVLIFIVMINVVRTEKRLTALWVLVLCASCILSAGAINDYRLNRLALQGERIKGVIGGLFDNPNDLALHLVTMIPIAVALFLKSRNPFSKIVLLLTVVLLLGGVIATFSRGGFLALLIVLTVLLWKAMGRARWLIPPVAAALLLLFLLSAPGSYGMRVSSTSDESTRARVDDLKRSVFIAARHPVFGVGMDNYILYSNSNKASHNAYTQVAAEMGLAALTFYVLFIVVPFKGLRKIEREAYPEKATRRFYYLAIALQASLAAYMVASFFASVAYLWYIYYLVGYSICVRRLYESTARNAAKATTTDQSPSPAH